MATAFQIGAFQSDAFQGTPRVTSTATRPIIGPTIGPRIGPSIGPNPVAGLSIRLVAHSLPAGSGPFTLTTTGVLPAPLAAATDYYAIPVDADHLQLAASRADALAETAITLTDAGTGVHTLVTGAATEVPVAMVLSSEFTASFADNWIVLLLNPIPVARGDGPVQLSTDNTLPGGTLAATDYWFCASGDADSYPIATSRADALAGTAITITDAGVGTHTATAQPAAEHYEPITLPDSTFTVG